MFGADLASVDDPGQPDWLKAKQAGLGFVFLRSNYGTMTDPFYGPQVSRINALGIPLGAYLFLRFPFKGSQPASPEAQATQMIATLQASHYSDSTVMHFPPVIDLEFPGNGISDTGMTHAQALDWLHRAWKTLRDFYKTAPIIYTSQRVWIEDLGDPDTQDFTDSPLWLAHYAWPAKTPANLSPSVPAPKIPHPWGDADNWWIHQYQGDSLGAPGFACTVDLNRFNYMKIGASGDRVIWVQKRLGIKADGSFGPVTEDAIKKFQRSRGLADDGIIGPATFAALAWVTCQPA